MATTLVWAQFLCYFHICLHHALYKIHTWNLFAYEEIFAHEKIKSSRKSLVKKKKRKKKKKKTGPKKKESTILSRKEENSFVKVTGTGGASCWHPDFEQRSCRQNKTCHI